MILGLIRKFFRPALPAGSQYVEDTPGGKLYIEMRERCPDCRHSPPQYFEGPMGGVCVNVFCGDCGAGFNVTPVVETAERIGKNVSYIQKAG